MATGSRLGWETKTGPLRAMYARQAFAPLSLVWRQVDFAHDQGNEAVHDRRLAGEVVIERNAVDAQLGAELAHTELGDALLIDHLKSRGQDSLSGKRADLCAPQHLPFHPMRLFGPPAALYHLSSFHLNSLVPTSR